MTNHTCEACGDRPATVAMREIRSGSPNTEFYYCHICVGRGEFGCYFCPFTTRAGWIDLREKHPDLWAKSKALEDNSTMRLKFIKKSAQFPETNLIECGCFNGA